MPSGLEKLNTRYAAAVWAGDEDGVADPGHLFHSEIKLAADYRLALLFRSVVKHLPNRF